METRNFTSTLIEKDLMTSKSENSSIELKVLSSTHIPRFILGKRSSVTPAKVRPSNSMLGMRSLKPSKKILG